MFGLFQRSQDQLDIAPITEEVHTPENPYCGDDSCWCHADLKLHANATEFQPDRYSVEEVKTANHFFGF